MADKPGIVIADDHPLVRTGLRQVIEKEAGYAVVAEAGDGREALEQIRTFKPAVAILDIEMPVMSGLDAARRAVEEQLTPALIILTMYDEEELFNEAMDIGVLGYVLKDGASMDILKAISTVLKGEYFISPTLANYALRQRQAKTVAADMRIGLMKLSPSERCILKMIADQKTSAEIAELLSISVKTVDNHRTNICHKLGLSGINSLTRFALVHRTKL
jgi:DNA-binding NarL/FixJ family response regulator